MTNAGSRSILVTGGASGIGRAIAASFLEDGATVHIFDADAKHLKQFHADFPGANAILCDIGDADAVAAAFESIPHLDVLVNNAGIAGPAGRVETLDVDGWQRCVDVNLNGTFYVTRQAIPLLKKSDTGAIVSVSSNAGLMGCPDRSPYAATKWAVIGLTKTWAMELGPDNIRVNAVCPTSVEGERIDGVIARDAERLGRATAEPTARASTGQRSIISLLAIHRA